MILYPAIDLKDGACVRVVHGDLSTATVFNTSPGAQARAWADGGFHWIHVVDLNGAVSGQAVNQAAVEEILNAVSVPVQLGGGRGVEHRGRSQIAMHHAHARAVLQVDGGVEDHGRHSRKRARRERPEACDFSGWNCTPATLPRATAAGNRPPWST